MKSGLRSVGNENVGGVEGEVIGEHNSHGLCYDVQHEDGTTVSYDPLELEVLERAEA